MTVVYAHVIHSLRRATQTAPTLIPSVDIHARLDAYSEQLRLVQAEMQQQVREVQGSVSALVHSVVQSQTHALMSELQAVEAHMRQQQITLTEATHEARQAPHEAKQSASLRKHEARVKLLSLRQRDAVPSEKRAAVYALLDTNPGLSSYEIAEQTGYAPSTVQRYMRDWKTWKDEATSEAVRHTIVRHDVEKAHRYR